MLSVTQTGFKRVPIGRFLLAGLLIWSLLVSFSLAWNMFQLENQAEYLATEEAKANWNKDQAFRRWATRHGGLYVKPDARTPANPFLAHLPERDVVTTDGTKLTLMNPAYMMRQMTEEFEEMYGVKGSITGQILLNPINKADPWELQALKRFDKGETEIVEVEELDGEPYLRLMRPMVMKEGCVKCHGHLGFKVGDIRGGVSVSIPLAPYQASATKTLQVVAITHAGVWLLGLFSIVYAVQRSRRFEEERVRHEQAIKNIAIGVSTESGDEFFQHLVTHMATIFKADYAFIGVLNKDSNQQIKTLAVCDHGEIVDNIEYSLQGSPCSDVLNHSACSYTSKVQQQFPDDKLLADMAVESYIGKSLFNSKGEPIGVLVVLDSEPLQRTEEVGELLDIFAARTSGEIERMEVEASLRRSQKMDAIGQLSGGIAHDFNNQLGIIIGYLDFLKDYVGDDEKPAKWVEISTSAALRCTDLTRQLLSFSRTHTNEKLVVDINVKLKEMQTMFARSVTPAIDVQYSLSENLWLTKIDPGDFQDAILNLVINARDAMPGGGQLLIETSNKTLDADSVLQGVGEKSGDYVQLIISDNGCGMDKATQERVFEPFYTTKPKGKGTGLGMSMVYGFVKRFGGFIKIYSEVDVGTTMRLYLPRCTETNEDVVNEQEIESRLSRGEETILVVDDEIDLLHLAENYLLDLGYRVVIAENAAQALDILKENKKIDMLFSDVVMPGGMNGYELAEKAVEHIPGLKVLLTSGFTSKTIAHNGLAKFSANLLNKPYRKTDLAQRIRQVLDEK